jgi:RNAse (barnase) inhibitor barstar
VASLEGGTFDNLFQNLSQRCDILWGFQDPGSLCVLWDCLVSGSRLPQNIVAFRNIANFTLNLPQNYSRRS